ncbi:MAG: hypothetical protein JW837_11595 [Sedimentisphaerales bacterium]|nr:hypothetical protein [Sedimentisphaerales bacterium]
MSLKNFQLKTKPYWYLSLMIGLLIQVQTARPAAYYDYKSLQKYLVSLAEDDPNIVRIDSLTQSMEKRKVWIVEVGRGAEESRKKHPAVLIVAGIEGNDLIGSSIAVSWLEQLTEQYKVDNEIAELLRTTTIYIIPRLNPDAAEKFFAEPKLETSLNNKPVDDDHDGLIDEDGPEDLNGDGLITWMRIEDKEGDYILDPVDNRLLLKADSLKSEIGTWRYLSEGIDNDKDEKWNEDGPGGVNFNRNFPFNYEFFAPDAGRHQVSEAQTRALAEFVVDHPNIGIIITYGAADNLLKTPADASAPGRRKPLTQIDNRDIGYYRVMGELYREAIGLSKELKNSSCPGTFSDWMYFHRGRLSLASHPWSPDIAIERSKSAEKDEKTKDKEEKKKNADSEKDKDKRNEDEYKQLEWFDENAPGSFIKWQSIDHPDFPDRKVEVGGYAPLSLTNPPVNMIEEIVDGHTDFLMTIIERLPRIGIRKIETEHLGQGTYDIKIQIENTGFLPTSLAHGQTTREVYPTRLTMELDDKYFLSGSRINNIPVISGSGGMVEVRYIVYVPDEKKIDFEVISMLAGQVKGTIDLKKNK